MHAQLTQAERPIAWAEHPASLIVRAAVGIGGVLLAVFLVFLVGQPGRPWAADSTEPVVYSLLGVAVGVSVTWAALRPTRRSLMIADLTLVLIPVVGIVL